jgi:hypothetical protein
MPFPMNKLGPLCVLGGWLSLSALAGRPGAAAEPAKLIPVEGQAYEATLTAASADWELTFDQGERRELAAQDLVTWGSLVEPRQEPQILLADGGLLAAEPLSSDGEKLTADSAMFGEVSLPLEHLAGIVFHPPADRQRADLLAARLWSAAGKSDRLILDNGDELTGTVSSIGASVVEFASNVGKVKLETYRIAALAFDPSLISRPRHRGLYAVAGFEDGSRLYVSSLEVSDKTTQVRLPGLQAWTARPGRLVFLQPLGGRASYVSDLKPTGYRHIPFLELSWPYRLDRNVQGAQLRAGGRLYLKGVGMHSASRLTFPLDGSHRRFAADLAIDSSTGGRGSVVFRVFADTQQLYASPVLRGDTPATPISVELPADAKTLSLIVDFAERGDELDHANWLNARLVAE